MHQELGLDLELRDVGKIAVQDERSRLKLCSCSSHAVGARRLLEPDHIADLRYWEHFDLERATADHPEQFTPTFLQLYRFFRRSDDHLASRQSA